MVNVGALPLNIRDRRFVTERSCAMAFQFMRREEIKQVSR
jgi:hypothetical protein